MPRTARPTRRTQPAPPAEREVAATAQGGERAAALVRAATGLPHAVVRGLFEHGCVTCGGAECRDPGRVLAAGERLAVHYDPARRYRSKAALRPDRAFSLVFEDPYLLVVDKAAGVLTVPNKGEPDTLHDAVRRYLGRGRKKDPRLFVVHRLDRETTGLLVFARTPDVAQALKAQFAKHKPERLYVALLAGRLDSEQGTFRSRLATDPALNQHSTTDPDAGKLAVTHYRVTQHLPGATAVEVRLETGRRNQIRVHFAEAGHPVLGDPRYAPEQARHPRWRGRRMALHAALLGFTHPVTGRSVRFESPLPAGMAGFLAQSGRGAESGSTPESASVPAVPTPAAARTGGDKAGRGAPGKARGARGVRARRGRAVGAANS